MDDVVKCERGANSGRPKAGDPSVKPTRCNTVQLRTRCTGDAGPWRAGRLGPGPVPGPLHVPLDVLALDDPRVGTSPSGRVESLNEQGDGVPPAVVSRLRGKNRAPLRSSGERL
jgi:hypothetical protein